MPLYAAGVRPVLELPQRGAGRTVSIPVPQHTRDQALADPLAAGKPGLVFLLLLRHWLVLRRPSHRHQGLPQGTNWDQSLYYIYHP